MNPITGRLRRKSDGGCTMRDWNGGSPSSRTMLSLHPEIEWLRMTQSKFRCQSKWGTVTDLKLRLTDVLALLQIICKEKLVRATDCQFD